jgi:hypothetical protein
LPCLEEQGPRLGPECADAIVAAKHAISSLGASQKKASVAMDGSGHVRSIAAEPPPAGAKPCPPAWTGPQARGCCTKRWSPTCASDCASLQCRNAGATWDFKWLDFRVHPYTCCPRSDERAEKYVGGQPFCPKDWSMESKAEGGVCCRKPWTWGCGRACAEDLCKARSEFMWTPVDENKEHYRCCPRALAGSKGVPRPDEAKKSSSPQPSRATAAMPDGLGSSWVGQPINLASSGWTSGGCVLGVMAIFVLARRWLAGASSPTSRYNSKDS